MPKYFYYKFNIVFFSHFSFSYSFVSVRWEIVSHLEARTKPNTSDIVSVIYEISSLAFWFLFYLFVNSQVRLFLCLLSLLLVGFLNRLCQSLHHLGQITIMTPLLGHYGSIGYTCGYPGNGRGRGTLLHCSEFICPGGAEKTLVVSVSLSVDRLKYCVHMSKIYLSRSKGLAKPIITG